MVGAVTLRLASFCLLPALGALATSLACVGPPAPDAAVCQDVIHRLCREPLCSAMEPLVGPGESCEDALLLRTGCGVEDFAFTGLRRDKFLQCRVVLLRAGQAAGTHPACEDVEDFFHLCDDVEAFLRTGVQ